MAISDATRKLLWGRSGGSCAICRCPLTQDASTADPAAIIGEEVHIVSKRRKDPRYRPLPPRDVDGYDNLLLLCPNHHTLVDKQILTYPEEKLRQIKNAHERWVRERQDHERKGLRLRDRYPGAPLLVSEARTDGQVLRVVGGSHAYQYSKPDDLTESEAELVADFLQDLSDWMDIWDEIGPAGQVRAEKSVGNQLLELRQLDLVPLVARREQILEGGIADGPSTWYTAVVIVERASALGSKK